MNFLARLRRFNRKPISRVRFYELLTVTPRRFSFAKKPTALKRGSGGPATGFLVVSFLETFELLLPWAIETASGPHGNYVRRVVRSEAEFASIQQWIAENRDLVFIRSLLESCVALSEHQSEPGVHTEVGGLENAAKFHGDVGAEARIVSLMVETFKRVHGRLGIDAICSVPPSNPGQLGLPNRVAAQLAEHVGLPDLTEACRWGAIKPSIKSTPRDQKWDVLEQTGITIGEALRGKNVLIIDDMYQSGCTVHFFAQALRKAGAEDLHCLSIVKALSDSDNTK